MMYTLKINEKTMAKAHGVSLPVSLKQSAEVCRYIRSRRYRTAINLLEEVTQMKTPVPYKRFNKGGTGHRKSMGPGRYPIKASTYILNLLKSAYANANQKGLDTSDLLIKSAVAKQGPKVGRYGRKRGRTAKRTHIEIVLMQTQTQKPQKSSPKQAPQKITPKQVPEKTPEKVKK